MPAAPRQTLPTDLLCTSFSNYLSTNMALWTEDDYGTLADRSCWSMFAILTGRSAGTLDDNIRTIADATASIVLIGMRVFCRLNYGMGGLVRGLGLDDIITVFCWLVFLVTCILITIGSSHGLGRHMNTLEPEQILEALKYNVIISSVLIWAFSLPKFAIVALLKRIINYGVKTSILFWGLALTSQACILATSVWWFKQCSPIERGWDQSVEGSCADVSVLANLGYFTSAYSAFLDIFFALYPIPLIMRLNLRMRSRVTISIAMGLSALACVVSIYKLAIFGQVFALLPVDPTCEKPCRYI